MANYFSTWKISRDSRRPRCPSPGRILPERWNISCKKTWKLFSAVVIRNFTMQPPFTLPLVSLMPKLQNKETSEPLIIGAHLSIAKSPPAIVGLRIGWLKSSVLTKVIIWFVSFCLFFIFLWSALFCILCFTLGDRRWSPDDLQAGDLLSTDANLFLHFQRGPWWNFDE